MKRILLLFAIIMVSCSFAFSQQRTVSGKVTAEDGTPIPGISVAVKGTSNGAITDQFGAFQLSLPPGSTLEFRGIGYTTKDIPVTDRSEFSITLNNSVSRLDELVVTAEGVKREAGKVGYAVSTVDSKDLNVARPVNVEQGLVGRVAGLQVSTLNNGVNPTVRIQLRGERHLFADNEPLIIVDGMEVRPDYVATLNPDDVASTSVLKGATAAALYGAEASNGVLIITTKRGGDNGKPIIRFSTEVGTSRFSYFPSLQNQFSGYGGESGNFFFGPAINPYTGLTNYIPFENQQYGPPFGNNPANAYIGGPNANGKVYQTPFSGHSPDWRLAFFQTGINTQNNASYSGGDDKNSYYLGIQDVNTQDPVPSDQGRRTSVNFSGKRTYGAFSVNYNFAYSHTLSNTAGNDFTQGGAWPIYWVVLNTPANVPLPKLKNVDDPNSFANVSNYYNAYYTNPWWAIDHARNVDKTDNLQGGLDFNLHPVDWFNLEYKASGQVSFDITKNSRDLAQFSPYSQTDPWKAGNYESGGNDAGALTDQNTYFRRLQQDVMATFHKKMGILDASLIVGNTIWDHQSNTQYDNSNNLFLNGLFNISYIQGFPTATQYFVDERRVGVYGDLTLTFANSLTLHGNFRRDWSSLLAASHNHYDVYAVDAAWIFTESIPSMKNWNFLSYGKLRGAYSSTGQISASAYSILPNYNVLGGFPYGSLASLAVGSTYNNPNLVPEKTVEEEGGIELGFWNDRISFDATYYHDITSQQTFPIQISPSTGYTSAYVNAGAVATWGEEFDLKVTPVRTQSGLRWDVGINLANNDSKVLSLLNGVNTFYLDPNNGSANYAIVGQPFPVMQQRDFERDPQGHVVVDPTTGYPLLDNSPTGLKIVGRTTPKYILGINTTLSFRNLSLTIVADYRGGYVFYSSAGNNLDFTGASAHTTENGRQNFLYPNSVIDENGKYVTNTSDYTVDGNLGFWVNSQYRASGTAYTFSADAWKLRSVSLTYDLGKTLHRVLHFVNGTTISLIGNNLLEYVPKENLWGDPEFNYGNTNSLGYQTFYQLPPTRSFNLSLSFTF
jgi:TonB-linked SusC/RagA family outer membrane protein